MVSPQNPVKALDLDEIAKIFAGTIKDWSEVGGNPGKIKLYARDAKSGTFDTFDNLVLKPRNMKISAEAQRFESNPELSDETARDPDGIGFAGFAYIRNAKPLAISSQCGIVMPPQVFSVKTEEYPLSRPAVPADGLALSGLGSQAPRFRAFGRRPGDGLRRRLRQSAYRDANLRASNPTGWPPR